MNTPVRLLTLVLLTSATAGLRAANEPPETVITSDQMEAHSTDKETFSTFTGHVVVDSNNVHIVCDRLDTVSSRSGNKSEIIGNQAQFEHLQADGHVHIVQGDREAVCGHAEVLEGQDRIVLTQEPVIINHSDGTIAAGETITLLRSSRKILIDHPHIVGPPMKEFNLDKSELPPAPAAPPPSPAAPAAPTP